MMNIAVSPAAAINTMAGGMTVIKAPFVIFSLARKVRKVRDVTNRKWTWR